MKRRTYTGEADLKLLQDFNAAAIAANDHCEYLHPGDIPHHIYNGNNYYDPVELMTIWEDDQGVAAWLLVGPRHKSYDAQVRPDLRDNDFEREVLVYADARTIGPTFSQAVRFGGPRFLATEPKKGPEGPFLLD